MFIFAFVFIYKYPKFFVNIMNLRSKYLFVKIYELVLENSFKKKKKIQKESKST